MKLSSLIDIVDKDQADIVHNDIGIKVIARDVLVPDYLRHMLEYVEQTMSTPLTQQDILDLTVEAVTPGCKNCE